MNNNLENEEINKLKKKLKTANMKILELDKYIHTLKYEVSRTLNTIRDLNESNNYDAPEITKLKISEICTNKIYELNQDEIDKKIKELNKNN